MSVISPSVTIRSTKYFSLMHMIPHQRSSQLPEYSIILATLSLCRLRKRCNVVDHRCKVCWPCQHRPVSSIVVVTMQTSNPTAAPSSNSRHMPAALQQCRHSKGSACSQSTQINCLVAFKADSPSYQPARTSATPGHQEACHQTQAPETTCRCYYVHITSVRVTSLIKHRATHTSHKYTSPYLS